MAFVAAASKVFQKLLKKYGPKEARKRLRAAGFDNEQIRAAIAKYNKRAADIRRGSTPPNVGTKKRLLRLRRRAAERRPALYDPKGLFPKRKKTPDAVDTYLGAKKKPLKTVSPGFNKALDQRIRNLKRIGVDRRVPIGKPKVRTRLEDKASGYKKIQEQFVGAERDALTTLSMRNTKMKAEVTKALRGYTPGSTPQTAEIRQKKGLVIRMLQKMGFMNPRGQGGRGMANQRHWDEVDEMKG